MKKLGNRAFLSAFALLLFTLSSSAMPPDSSKAMPKGHAMPSHGPSHAPMIEMFKDTVADSLKFPAEPFDSTLLEATFVIETHHKLFPKFLQLDTVKFGQIFVIGEEDEYQAKVTRFNPHLAITSKGQYLRLSDTLYNPAVRVEVTQADSVVQRSWAFHYTAAPHFKANQYLGFKLVSFDVNSQRYIKLPDGK